MRPDAATTRLATLLLQLLPLFAAEAATITVTTSADSDASDSFCSLREAILAANTDTAHNDCPAGSGADRIVFALTLPDAIVVGSDLPAVTDTVAIRGPGADQLAVDGLTLHRLFNLASASGGEWFLLEDLSVLHGYSNTGLAPDGGGIYVGPGDTAVLSRLVVAENRAANGGGGIAVDSSLGSLAAAEIVDCTILGNVAGGATGGGGLLLIDGSTVEIRGSALLDNRAEGANANGGGVVNQRSTLLVVRSTISGNSANVGGGGLFISSASAASSLTLVDSTVHDNQADADLDSDGDGGGIFTCCGSADPVTLDLRNSIVAGNVDALGVMRPDLAFGSGPVTVTSSFNLLGANDGVETAFPSGSPNAQGDFVGTLASPIDPMLQALDLNQGVTLSHRPVLDAASPVIDHGSCPDSDADQRGSGAAALHRRAYDHPGVPTHAASDGCDIGSVERGASANSATALFEDGFELGHTLRWNLETP